MTTRKLTLEEVSSLQKQHPVTTVKSRCFRHTFNTGHTLLVWEDGTRYYLNPRSHSLNPLHAVQICADMDQAAAAGIQE